MQRHLSSLLDRVAPVVRDASVTARSWYGAARERSMRYASAARRAANRWTFELLGPVETTLLNAASRERIHATATFSLIFLFAIASVDFLIAGGPEFGVPARAEQSPATYAASRPAPRQAPAARPDADETAELAPALAEATAANVTNVSQIFDVPANPPEQPVAGEPSVAGENQAGGASLAGDGADAPAAEPSGPIKRGRVKSPANAQVASDET